MTDEPAAPQPEIDNSASSPFLWPPLIFALSLVLAVILTVLVPWRFLPEGFAGFLVRLAGLGLSIVGILVAFRAERLFKSAGTPVPPTKPTKALVTAGVYNRTRNPMYLGLSITLFGLGFVINAVWFLILTPIAMLGVQKLAIEREEHYLEGRFGDAYRAYRGRVRRWI